MTSDYYDSIDLRQPIKQLFSKWHWIAGAAVLTTLAALILTLLLPTVYQAEATIAISPSRTEVQFDERIQTLADYQLLSGTLTARKDSLIALVRSNEVVEALLDDISEHLDPEERDVTSLRELMNIQTTGDLINIRIRYEDPETAALIANAWVEHYERHVNQVYSDSGRVDTSRINEQVENAGEAYRVSQAELENFLAVDPIETLQRELDTKLAVLENYQLARISAQSKPVERNQQILDSHYLELARVETWLADAEALREQVALGTESPAANMGNALALISLRSRAFGGSQWVLWTPEGDPVVSAAPEIQVDISTVADEPVRVSDVDAVITALERRREAAQSRVDAFLEGLQSGDPAPGSALLDERIAEIASEVNSLQSQVEAATAEQLVLTNARDSAWETYLVLRSRQTEEQIASETTSTEVRIADRAIVPSEPISRGLIRNTAIAMILGVIVSSAVILVRAWWRMEDDLQFEAGANEQLDTLEEMQEPHGDTVARQGLPESLSS